ncbi:MAG: sensor histidine kinase [Chitinophagaceae bacterium]|nr:sensor histidine kinase [Chitinophagaceae bacterium]
MKKIAVIIILGFFTNCALCQHLNKDSLQNLLHSTKEDTAKIRLYYKLAIELSKEDLPAAEKYCQLVGTLSRKINYKQGIRDYYSQLSNILSLKGEFDEALKNDLEAVDFAKSSKDSIELARTLFNVAITYQRMEDIENSVAYTEQARDIILRNHSHLYEGEIYNLLQRLYFFMHQYSRAVQNGRIAVAALEKADDNNNLQYAYNNLGLNYIMIPKYDSAKYFLRKASEIAESSGETMIQITTKLNFALISLKLQQTDSVKIYAQNALALSRKLDAPEFVGLAQYGLAYYYLQKKEYAYAQRYADSVIAIAMKYNMRDLKQKIYVVLSGLNYALQDVSKGIYYFNQYELLSDSILNESIARNTIQSEKKYETQRKETQILQQQAALKQKALVNYFLIAGIAALILVSLLGYRNYRNRQRLQQAKIDELETEKHLTATEAVLKGEEQERTRLAKDLHDGLGGMLSGIKYSLSNMKGNLIMTPDNAQAFERSMDMLDSSIKEMRRVAHNMMPEVLVKYGLDAALKEFCGEINRSGVIRANYHSLALNEVAIEQTTSVTVYRIVQELVNNVIKHAAASSVIVQVQYSQSDKLLTVTVEDDGKGFDMASLKDAHGIGWSNIKSRVDFLKGKIDVQTGEGKGTSVLIEIVV